MILVDVQSDFGGAGKGGFVTPKSRVSHRHLVVTDWAKAYHVLFSFALINERRDGSE